MPVFIPEALLPITAFLIAAGGLYLLLSSGLAQRLAVDIPNHRSLHIRPVPRVGGLVLIPAFLLVWLLPADRNLLLALLVAVLCLFSYMDDRSGLPAILRLSVHMTAAAVLVVLQLDLPGTIMVVAAILWVGWCTNLYNFMDGSDGLAGGMALFGFSAYGLAAVLSGNHGLGVASLSVAAAAAGFLLFNFHPARIFLGDAGSIPLGFLAGALGLLGWHDDIWPLWFPALVFSPFIVDASVTLLKRALRGERVWQAHHEHYYQRLVRMGWGHRRLALTEYVLMAIVGGSALVLLGCIESMQYAGLLIAVSIYAVAMVTIDLCWKKHLSKTGKS